MFRKRGRRALYQPVSNAQKKTQKAGAVWVESGNAGGGSNTSLSAVCSQVRVLQASLNS